MPAKRFKDTNYGWLNQRCNDNKEPNNFTKTSQMQTKEKVGWIVTDCHETVGGRVNALQDTTAND